MGVWLWQFTGRIALLALLPTVLTLSGCWDWAVAGPLLGVGTVGTGVAVAEVEHSKKTPTQSPATQLPTAQPPEIRQPENGSEGAAQPDNQQGAAKNIAAPVVGAPQEFTLPTTPKVTPLASVEKATDTRTKHHGEEVVVRSHRPRPVAHKHHPTTARSRSSTPPTTLPATFIVD